MFKLVLVGCGDSNRFGQYIQMIQAEISFFIKQQNFRVYDTKRLLKAETDVNLLKRNSKLSFQTSKDTTQEYWCVDNRLDYIDLHSRWFSSVSNDDVILNKPMPYSRSRMVSLIKEWIVCSNNCTDSLIYDSKIKYCYKKVDNEKNLCVIEWLLNENEMCPMEIFQSLLIKLDEYFPDVFLSAYITDRFTQVEDIYFHHIHFDYNLIASKIIDIGYVFYVCKKIEQINGIYESDNLELFIKKTLSNGTLYTYEGMSDKCNYCLDDLVISFLEKVKIPNFCVLNWSHLCNRKVIPLSTNELVSVYHDCYSPKDPVIVFSFGYNSNQLNNLPMLYDLNCKERYSVKDIVS